ncbi:MAG: antibiotic biosynthesis monooxygenase [Sphingomonadales bacterium]|nr:antibiotic biosynthesis monooxygenase [Sphingomonadales bacterium]NCQ21343.1 antibiotic biosynthesis monooxygenase [Sphingomonadales bacterium]NCT03506.1 antibiotic biosynthesis monooxygenase [Sphingomonadales bacterium]
MIARREFVGAAALGLLAAHSPLIAAGGDVEEIYGLIGQLTAVPGKREELISVLLEASAAMRGNLLYLVAEDLADPDLIWITEVWRTRTDHQNSLKPEAVQSAIARARPLIAGFGLRAETRPVNHAN